MPLVENNAKGCNGAEICAGSMRKHWCAATHSIKEKHDA
jgi:hypothetical protein